MKALQTLPIRAAWAALLAMLVGVARGDDDVVADEQAPPPVAAPQPAAGRVIVMPGLRLQIGPGGALQIQGQGQAQFGGAVPQPGKDTAAEKAPYLGVVTGAVPPPVRAQLDLPEGVGIAVEAVAEGSPAGKAGVRQHDVIRAFNDQVICSPEQLATLVRLVGAGTKAPLKILRGGREQVVEVTIEEGVAPQAGGVAVVAGGLFGPVQAMPLDVQGVVEGAAPGGVPDEVRRRLEAVLGRMPGGLPGVAADVQAQVLTIGPNVATQSMTVVSDARGTIELRETDGKRTVTIKDPSGKEVHAGPLDTDEDLAKVPEEFRDWVREVDGGQAVVERIESEAVLEDSTTRPKDAGASSAGASAEAAAGAAAGAAAEGGGS